MTRDLDSPEKHSTRDLDSLPLAQTATLIHSNRHVTVCALYSNVELNFIGGGSALTMALASLWRRLAAFCSEEN